MITHYFGTDTRSAGHYLWTINQQGTHLESRTINFRSLPFSPEYVTENMANGSINWQHHISRLGSFTVCAIAGSPVDGRPGCKSVFIVNKYISFEMMYEEIMSTPVCKVIIDKMPFAIDFYINTK